jgi:hypothetical protein
MPASRSIVQIPFIQPSFVVKVGLKRAQSPRVLPGVGEEMNDTG